jgi:hypothetical protein
MKNNLCNRAAVFGSVMVVVAVVVMLWPATGRGQTSSRRERFRRDASARSSSSRSQQASRQTSEPNAVAARPAETTRSIERRRVEGTGTDPKYEIILNRNIFSRQRTPYRPQDKNVERQVVVPNPETHFLLKGIVQENSQFIAFVEDTQGGGVLRLRQGDRVARGQIKALSLDALEYQLEDKTISVKLGCDLEGARGTTAAVDLFSAPQVTALAPTTAPASQQAQSPQKTAAPSPGEADILKRLMEQRRRQLGQ